MDYEGSAIPQNMSIKVHLNLSVVHQFDKKKKKRVVEGPCEIYVSNDIYNPTATSFCYLKVDSFIDQIGQPKKLVRITYPENTSFLFYKQSFPISSISFHKNTQNLGKFEEIIGQFAKIVDFTSISAEDVLMQMIKENCPDNIQTKDITSDAKSFLKKVGKNVGLFMGKVNNVVSKPANGASQILSERASRISRDSISDETKTKWNNFKQKSDQFNQTLSKIFRPAVTAFNNISDSIGQAFYSSNNTVIKNIREHSLAFSQSLNEAEKSTHTEAPPKLSEEQQSNYQLK